jgi:DNA sulfur modification protein DndD
MIFKEICIENLFSYYGKQVFQLPPTNRERPIVLISGRNGFGKTSFINSVKLLFLGTNDDMLRTVKADTHFKPNTYLLGDRHTWRGIFNRRMREENNPKTHYGVHIVWQEDQGEVSAERYWVLSSDGRPEQRLCIETDFGHRIDNEEDAEEFLERRLPKSIVPFFFYDGERVQQIAEGTQEGQLRQMERLLGISAIDTLDEYLGKVITTWRREGQAAPMQLEIDALKADIAKNVAISKQLQLESDELQRDIDDEERSIKLLEDRNAALSNKALQAEWPHLQEKLQKEEEAYEESCRKVAETLPLAAPLWAVPKLVREVANRLDNAASDPNRILSEQIQGIFADLPEKLFDKPYHSTPPLEEEQKRHYKEKLERLFAPYVEPPRGGFFSLNATQIREIRNRFEYYRQAQTERLRLVEDLKTASTHKHEIVKIQAQRDALDNISEEERQSFQKRENEIAEARKRQDERNQKIGGIREKQVNLSKERKKLEEKVSKRRTEIIKAETNSLHINRAREAQDFFREYKRRLKESQREKIERAVNHRLKCLMTSHGLIDSIGVDNELGITYRDSRKIEIGGANLSAGMKQLAAQALLWALSEVSERHIPIIVDTPLARIDRIHQENLLRDYYPHAGEQVIVLPTDSEIDREKYRILLPYIAGEFRLENSDGEHTNIIENTKMYELEAC